MTPQNSRTKYVQHDTLGRLHRYILGITDPSIIIDHIDRNGLNNQRSNLRITNNQTNKRNQAPCTNNKFNFNGLAYEPPKGTRSGRIKVSWSEYEYKENTKRNRVRSRSFSINKYGKEEAIKQAVLTRIAKMREFDYTLDERSETIEKQILENKLPIDIILGVNLDFVK